jgi:hypothetical protein
VLVSGGLLSEVRRGRNRYVELAGPETARLLEGLAALAPRQTEVVTGLKAVSRREALARARTCYDHLAGRLGVAVADSMTERGLIDWTDGVTLTPDGQRWLTDLGVTVERLGRRPMVRSCLDLTERRPHLAGAVGAALCRHVVDQGWVRRIAGDRALRVTRSVASLGLPDDLVRELSGLS